MMRRNAIVFALIAGLLAILSGSAAAEITGPESSQAGQIAVFTSDAEAAWAVIPETYAPAMYVDTSQRTLIFASPNPGIVTIAAATITEGTPTISVKTFYNGVVGPNPDPTPSPSPEPEPTTLEGVAKSAADKIISEKAEEERTAVAESFQIVVDGIQRGTIRTAPGARSTLRQVWLGAAVRISPESAKNWQPFFDAISNLIEPIEIGGLKNDFQTVIDALKVEVVRLPKGGE